MRKRAGKPADLPLPPERVMIKLIDKWLEFKEHNEGKSPKTIYKYRYYLELFVQYANDHSFTEHTVTEEHIENFVGMYLHQRQLVAQSRRTAVAAIRGFFQYLVKIKHTSNNAAYDLPYPAKSTKMPVAMGITHFEKLLQQCDLTEFLGLRDATIIALLGGCGFRIGGLTGLNESSLLWYEFEGKERLAIKVFEKRSKERMVPVPMEAQVYLRAYLGHRELKAINRSLPNGDKVLLVSTRNRKIKECDYFGENRRLSAVSIGDMITKRGIAASIPIAQCHPHALRHLTGTEYAEEDVDLIQRQQLLGHAKPESTAIYTQLAMRRLTRTIDKANPLGKINTAVTPLIKEL